MKSLVQVSLIGNPAPDFTLKNQDGKLVSLSDHRGSWTILYFYPKDMTSGCTLEAQEFRDHEYELEEVNATVLGVSADDVKSHKKFCDEANLNFTLLSDPTAEVCKIYDVWREKTTFGTKHEGIDRTTFLINPEGKVAKLYSSVKPLGHAEKVIADIRELEAKRK
ncbi:MAG TPA: thioredoxin-dependent thiol peroxidase [Candidatus Paceibacterota bacterium]|nr:thioredoxin-dependent thiol peroxidase [Candidatus Paceibacterota bacterium]